eukprot:TRINITY_DN10111_c0_g1_i3.p1 TRINITY_DN10111_c0_g1~~TRINITY_DN10111_c0_g1_i3.p1  ORF type:complete len:744 (+),score=211.36 TRINITY_DN10111_c0_g1_i3:109-2340(+)
MTSIVRFRALSGAQNEDPLCYLLELDNKRILLDCGWNESFDVELLSLLKEVAPTVDVVLLSHPDLLHLGAYPYAFTKLGLTCPAYATTAVENMGQLFLYDAHQARTSQEDFDLFTLDDVDDAFAHITKVNYLEAKQLLGTGIQVSAYRAGHMIGGAVWQITKDDESIIYAVDYNHRRERHLESTAFDFMTRPYMLITNSLNARYQQKKRRDRDIQLMETLTRTLRNNGDVLLVADTAGRSLELLQLLDQKWSNADAGLGVYPLIYLNSCASSTLKCARTLTQFMSDKMQVQAQAEPFPLHTVRSSHVLDELQGITAPKVVVVAQNSLEAGFSRQMLLKMADNPNSLILFTARPYANSLGDQLLRLKATQGQEPLQFTYSQRVPLQGDELAAHRAQEREKIEAQKAEALRIAQEEKVIDEEDDAVDEAMHAPDAEAPAEKRAKLEADSFFKARKQHRALMFTYTAPTQIWDDYGIPFDRSKLELLKAQDELTVNTDADVQATMAEAEAQEAIASQVNEVLHEQAPPSKVVSSRMELHVACKAQYLDFEGLSDGEAMLRILGQVKPRNLVLIHGNQEDTKHLANKFTALANEAGFESRLETPGLGDVIDATSERNIFQIKLRDILVSQLKFRETGGYKVAWVEGLIQHNELDAEHAVQQAVPELVAYEGVTEHQAVFVGDLKLSELRKVLHGKNMEAEFSKGTLICADKVQVSLDPSRQGLLIDGPLCPEYYAIRDIVYGQFASA